MSHRFRGKPVPALLRGRRKAKNDVAQGKNPVRLRWSRGIGLAIALRAARDGANVTIAAKTAEPHPELPGTIHTAAEEIEAAGGKALPLVCDVRDEAPVSPPPEQTVAKFGGIDICVNNASAIQLTGARDRHETL